MSLPLIPGSLWEVNHQFTAAIVGIGDDGTCVPPALNKTHLCIPACSCIFILEVEIRKDLSDREYYHIVFLVSEGRKCWYMLNKTMFALHWNEMCEHLSLPRRPRK